jgi:hypothetical protein
MRDTKETRESVSRRVAMKDREEREMEGVYYLAMQNTPKGMWRRCRPLKRHQAQ